MSLTGYIRCLDYAASKSCRVKTWNVSNYEALRLANILASASRERQSLIDIYEGMKRGEVSLLGAKIAIRPTPSPP